MQKTFYILLILLATISCKNTKSDTLVKETNTVIKSDSQILLTEEELKGKTYEELRILRNEIFARKGYVFKDSILNKYFSSKIWYKPNKNAQITLTDVEKKNIELIKSVENKLKPFELPKGYEKITGVNRENQPKKYSINKDIDNDKINDVIQLANNISNKEKVLFIYLSKSKKTHKIILDKGGDYEVYPYELTFEKDLIGYGFHYGSAFYREFKVKYNSKIKDFQLVTYSSSNRIMYGHTGKVYNLISGVYEVAEEAARIYDTSKMITVKNKGKQETKIITPDLINDSLYEYLDNIGAEFEEDDYSHYYGEHLDCREAIIQRLALDFEYGKNNYLGRYKIFEEPIKNFIQSIKLDDMLKSGSDSYSKTYKLHRNWNLEYIEKDECEDELFIRFNNKENTFSIIINNCATVIEDGEAVHASEQSIIFEYSIEKNCTYKFKEIVVAG